MAPYKWKGVACALDDFVLCVRLAEVIASRGLVTVVETGIDKGGSSWFFSQMAEKVVAIDNVQSRVDALIDNARRDAVDNISTMCMNSPDALRQLVDQGLDASTTLFFLDAHWQSYWPLKDEIRAIPRGQGVLVMHDVVVPGCPRLGFDVYNGQALDYDYVRDALMEWSPEHVIEYNDDTATGSRRGVMIVYPS